MTMVETAMIRLDERGLVSVSGSDARSFLDAIITNDIDRLRQPGDALAAALLTPQGKILFEMLIVAHAADRYLIDVAASERASLIKRLGLYRLRAKVEIADISETTAVVLMSGGGSPPPAAALVSYGDPRAALLGRRAILPRPVPGDLVFDRAGAARYHEWRIEAGVAEILHDYMPADVFPHDVNMDLLGTVDFKKGCYVGQEVVARTQHKALPRKRIARIEAAAGGLTPGAVVMIGEAEIGRIGTIAGDGRRALALVRLDRVVEAHDRGQAITSSNASVAIDRALIDGYRAAAAARTASP